MCKSLGLLIIGVVILVYSLSARAQEGGKVVYDKSYFTKYKPVTLEDMVRNIPGGVTVLNDLRRQSRNGKRGFGSNGPQFLINGKRMSGKSNDISKQLARVQASQVDHIELIRGTAEGLDIHNNGILYNVILKEDASSSTTSVKIKGNYARQAGFIPEFLLSYNGASGAWEYGISYEYGTKLEFTHVRENVLDSDHVAIGFRPLTQNKRFRVNSLTSNITYNFTGGDVIRLNGLLGNNSWKNKIREEQFSLDELGSRTLDQMEKQLSDNKKDNWEIGGDYDGKIKGLGQLKALFVVNRATHDDLFSITDSVARIGDDPFLFKNDYAESEQIIRTSLSTSFGKHTLDYGFEGAFNTLDKTVTTGGDPGEQTIVRENRYVVFATYSVAARENLNLQAGLTEEFSKITQTSSAIENSRNFKFLKPRFEARYDFTARDQIRFTAERTVSQLNLNNFVISRNSEDDSFNLGNPDLVPEKIWTYVLSYERRFAHDGGSLEFKMQYEDFSDKIDKIQIDADSSGIGNIGKASRLWLNAKANARLGFINMPTAVITLNYSYRHSSVIDPFTGQERALNRTPSHFWSIDYQHDIIDWDMSYGFNLKKRSPSFRQDISLLSLSRARQDLSLFAEYKLSRTMKLRFNLEHNFNETRHIEKIFYDGNIHNGIIDRIEQQDRRNNRLAMLTLQMTL